MAPPRPFEALGQHFAIDLPGARAVFTTRRGGHSSGPYASLNLGLGTGDDPACPPRNREQLSGELGVTLASGRQVHGTTIQRASGTAEQQAAEADGQLTTVTGLAPMVVVADCLPIVVAGDGAVAVLHAGWRGLAAGIVAAGVAAIGEAGAAGPLGAAIGPGAGGCCYEVGREVHEAFGGYPDAVHRGRCLDLKAVARSALERAGVSQVHDLGACTLCGGPELWFSHRRDGGVTGRQAGLAWLS